MREIIRYLLFPALIMLAPTGSICAQKLADSGSDYRLKGVIPVDGRQGIASDGEFYYVSGSTALYKYNKEGVLVAKNEDPFRGLPVPANHFGDIDVYNGEIFTGIEWFNDGVGRDIRIAVYKASDLTYKYSIDFDPSSGQTEVCGITIDPQRNVAWLADWVDGKYLYRYDLTTGKYAGKLHLRPVPQYQQGVYYTNGRILISADDGDADLHESDNIYIVDASDFSRTAAYVTLFKECNEFIRAGEIEGLCIDPSNGDLLVLANRGSRIVLGMVRGFYAGYTEEIHEVYIYERIK